MALAIKEAPIFMTGIHLLLSGF